MPSRSFPSSKYLPASSSIAILAHESPFSPMVAAKSHVSHAHSQLNGFKLGFALVVGAGIVAFALFLLLRLLKCRNWRQNSTLSKYSIKLKHFAYKELKTATQGFNGGLKLGQGGFGAVYKGVLKNGTEVAVKKLDTASFQGEREFQNELSVIGHVCPSPHIVPLVGFCSNGKERLLVYEYMRNRSLQEALFDADYPVQLLWDKRFGIIVDTCKALAFLHACDPPIIHGDIKPSNVLLDANFCAKIADFGLARFKTTSMTSTEHNVVLDEATIVDKPKIRCHRRGVVEKPRKHMNIDASLVSFPSIERVKEVQEHKEANSEVVGRQSTSTVFTTSPDSDASSSLGGNILVCESSQTSIDGNFGQHDSLLSDSDIATCASPLPNVDSDLLRSDIKNQNQLSREGIAHDCTQENGISDIEAGSNAAPSAEKAANGNNIKQISACGRDWWWKQESSGEISVREFVMDWMGHEERQKTTSAESALADHADCENKECPEKGREKILQQGLQERRNLEQQQGSINLQKSQDIVLHVDEKKGETQRHADDQIPKKGRNRITLDVGARVNDLRLKNNMHSSGRSASLEWWRNESREEGSGSLKSKKANGKERWKSREWWKDEEVASSKEWKAIKKKRERSLSREWSGELSSRGVSSTPSMRGTLCYVAPENGGNGILLSEKSDVYSFGVLLLVIISGRRPLQVMASPITEFERANLISWARHLAHSGNVLELLDPSLHGNICKKQATLTIIVALLCLQRLPAKRPSMIDVLKMLSGELEVPSLPFRFSPSPPCRTRHRSRRRSLSSEGVALEFTFSN